MITWILIGAGLGMVLEAAGFGNPKKLTGVFLFKDFAVPLVMGTAIVTAMACMLVLSLFGYDTSQFFTPATKYLAQAVGGLIFGVGFFLGGYCPGTSVVAAGSGRLDALAFMGGLVGGYYLWAPLKGFIVERSPGFFEKVPKGSDTLPYVLGVDARLLAAMFVIVMGSALGFVFLRLRRGATA